MLRKVSKSALIFMVFFSLAAILPGEIVAQTSREVESAKSVTAAKENPQAQEKVSKRQARKRKEKTYSAYFNNLVGEYEGRIKDNAQEHKKIEKELRKPQYSDRTYFGHKKKPKKRKNGQKKLCKECHMWH